MDPAIRSLAHAHVSRDVMLKTHHASSSWKESVTGSEPSRSPGCVFGISEDAILAPV